MTVLLPYHFDSAAAVRWILRGVAALLLLVTLPGIVYTLLVAREIATALPLLLAGVALVYFGRLFHLHLEGSRGVITTDAVVVEPSTLYGIRLTGPAGRFSIDQFECVRVESASASIDTPGVGSERVLLAGKAGTPDILLERCEPKEGIVLGEKLAAAMGLPLQQSGARLGPTARPSAATGRIVIDVQGALAVNRAGWDRVAPSFHGGTALPEYGPLAPTEDTLGLLDPTADLCALELGCGSGHSLRYLAERGALVEGAFNPELAGEAHRDPARWYSVERARIMPTTFIVKARKPLAARCFP